MAAAATGLIGNVLAIYQQETFYSDANCATVPVFGQIVRLNNTADCLPSACTATSSDYGVAFTVTCSNDTSYAQQFVTAFF